MTKSIKVNYFLNLLNTGSQSIFPLIAFPYICRVIGVGGIGQVDFYNSIISYITLFTSLGIPLYAIREVARVRDNAIELAKTTLELLCLHIILTLIGYLIILFLCLFVPQINGSTLLFLILSLTLIFTTIGCEWFYQGIEDFFYVTVRGLIVKILAIILLFVFVKEQNDIILYGIYSVFGTVGNNLFNFFRLRKYVCVENLDVFKTNLKRHIKPVLSVFSFILITSLYLKLNPLLLGLLCGTDSVGYYTAATRVVSILIGLSACLGNVMMPRVAHLIADGKIDECQPLLQKSLDYTLFLTIPLSVGLMVTAPYIITILCGEAFSPAITTSIIVAPIILMLGLSNYFGIQILYPMGNIGNVTFCCGIGAVVDLILCLLLLKTYTFDGAAFAYLSAEVITTLFLFIYTRKVVCIKLFKKQYLCYMFGSALMASGIYVFKSYDNILSINNFIIQVIIAVCIYVSTLLIYADPLLKEIIGKFHYIKFWK